MRKITLFSIVLILLSFNKSGFAQWSQSSITTGSAAGFVSVGSDLFAGFSGATKGVYKSTDNGLTWTSVNNTAPLGTTSMYSMLSYGSDVFAGASSSGAVFKSSDLGASWSYSFAGSAAVNSLVSLGSNIFAGVGNRIYRSTDNGATWAQVSTDGGNRMLVSGSQIIGSSALANSLYISSDTGNTWNLTNYKKSVNAIATMGSTILIGVDSLYASNDNGATWTARSVPSTMAITSLLVNGTNLFAGTLGGGVFLSTDNGFTWTAINTGLTNLTVYKIGISGPNLLAGTGAGVWVRALSDITTGIKSQTAFTDLNVYPNPTSGKITVTLSNNAYGNLTIDVFNATGEKIMIKNTSNEIDLSTFPKGVYFLNIKDLKNSYYQKVLVQ